MLANRPDGFLAGSVLGLCLSAIPFLISSTASAQAPSLGSAAAFAVLGASTVTNTGASAITGDVGVAPGTAITGFPPGIVTGTVHPGDPAATQAQVDVTLAYNALTAASCNTFLTGQDLGGMTLGPGVYCFTAAAQLTGTLTLDGLGNAGSVFIFKTGSTLTTAAASAVTLINGATASNVFWQIGSSATLGAANTFRGNVIALASITMGAASSVSGRLIARTAAVTLDTNSIVIPATAPSTAAWDNFGIGWPGAGGIIPTLTLSALPVLGTAPNMVVQNVRGTPTFGRLIWGTGPVSLPTLFGGDFQVQEFYGWPIPIGTGLHAMALPIPLNNQLIGVAYYVQIVQFDEGASHLVAFTRGLHLVLGL